MIDSTDSDVIDTGHETCDVIDTNEICDLEDSIDQVSAETPWDIQPSAAQEAADYVRSFEGNEKAADYVERHFQGSSYIPGDIIPVTTRNQKLEGDDTLEGVTFQRENVELADGLTLQGVFPQFESYHDVSLGDAVKDMSLHQQFDACRQDFQEHLYDNRENLKDFTLGDMERLEEPQGYSPEGFTWHHDTRLGHLSLVPTIDHKAYGHTGGNAIH